MLLRNFDIAVKYFDYISNYEVENHSTPKICGWYKFIDGQISALLVNENKLYFRYGVNTYLISRSHKVTINKINNNESKFSLVDGNRVIAMFNYLNPVPFLNLPPFDFINQADQDWGMFLEKILNNEERKRNFVLNLMEA